MILEFSFIYVGDNDFFEYLLRFYAKEYDYKLTKTQDCYTLIVKADEEQMLGFANKLEHIGNSVFLKAFEVKPFEGDFISHIKPSLEKFTKKDFLSYQNSSAYLNENKLVDNEWGEFVNLKLSFDKLDFSPILKENFTTLVDETLDLLCKGEKIFIQDECALYEVALFNGELKDGFLMALNTKAINTAFSCSNENLKLLASLEKPLIRLKFNAIFKSKYKPAHASFKLKLPSDLFFFALSQKLYEKGYNFLSFTKLKHFEDEFEVFELNEELIILQGFAYINKKAKELILSKEDKNFARLSYILSKLDEKVLVFELSEHYEDIILFEKEQNVLNLTLPQSFEELYIDIAKDEVGQRLLNNFKKEFPLFEGSFKLKNNFFSLLCLVGRFLNLDEDVKMAGEKLLSLSDQSRLPRGVKIDYRYKENTKEFDYTRTLRSTMSFMLAGVENTNIAYGSVESLAFFLRDLYDEFREKKLVESALFTGSLFSHKSLLLNASKHLKNSSLTNAPLRI